MQFQIKKHLLRVPRLLHVDAPPAMSRNLFRRALMGALTFLLLFQMQTVSAQTPQSLLNSWNSNGSEPGCEQWKITYPTGDEEKDLCNNVASNRQEFYYVNSAGNGIVFRTPIRDNNGTTPNSDNVRCELREREIDGDRDVEWTTSGQHVIYVKQAITHLPIQKDELVATQIHGDKAAGIDDAMVLRLEGSNLFLSFNGNVLRSSVAIKSNYSLGRVHEVIFQVIDGKHYCYYSEDGNLKNAFSNGNADSYLVKDGNNPMLMDKNYDQAYFKAGNYTQSNPDDEGNSTNNSNNYGEVVIYDLVVDHDGDFGSTPGGGSTCSAVVPGSRTVSNVGQTSATVKWAYSSSFNHYNVRYRKTGTSTWSYLTTLRLSEGDFSVSNNIASKAITGLSNNTTYQWQVRAKCDDSSIATAYNSGAGPNFTTSSSSGGGSTWTPDPNKKYYIDVPVHNRRIAAVSGGARPYTTGTGTTGSNVEWQFVAKGNGYWHIRRAAGGSTPGLRVLNSGGTADMQATSSSGVYTYYEFTTGSTSGTYFATLPDVSFSNDRIQVNSSSNISFVPSANSAGSWESLRFTEVPGSTTGGGGSGNNIVTMRKRNAVSYALDSGNNDDLYLYSYNASNVNQQWEEIDEGNGHYRYKKVGTNVCIDGGSGGSKYQTVKMETCDGSEDQEWKKINMTGNYYRLEKRNAESYSLDGKGSGTNGQVPHLWTNSNTNQNQHWLFTVVGTANRAAVTDTPERMAEAVMETGGSAEEHLSFWPNPSGSDLTVLIPDGDATRTTSVVVSDLLGRTVFQRTELHAGDSFQVSEPLSPGTYILRWMDEDGKVLQVDKLIRQ